MGEQSNTSKQAATRRSFLRNGLTVASAATMASGLLANGPGIFAQDQEEASGTLDKGDAALLRFAAAAEIIETDFWVQYNELAGIQDKEVPGGSGNPVYAEKLKNLDEDMDVYIHDNTDDEISHFTFLNAYLASKGADTVDLDKFRTLPSSKATGAQQIGRLTNLMQLTLDTSWWTRYRSGAHNPDLDPNFKFPQAVPDLSKGQFPAIPRTDDDLSPDAHIQAIANTAALHFPTIEQGGSTLYPAMAQRATSVEVLRILISIGPTENMHFQTWADKAGHTVSPPLAPLTDPKNGLSFPDLSNAGKLFTPNLIMPEPCPFLNRKLPRCSIVRPTETNGVAMGVVKFLTDMGLFIGQSKAFFELLHDLAEDADAARR
jgi:hypothetical protein